MKISHLQENLTPASAPSAPTPGPKFGRSDEMLESGASTTTAGVMSTGTPTNMGVQRRSKKGSDLLKGIKISEKYANSRKAGISEDAINEDDLSEEQLQAKKRREELFKRSKPRDIGNKPSDREIMAKEEFNGGGEYNDEIDMVQNNLHTIVRVSTHLGKELQANENMPEWVQEKIAVAKSMMVTVMDYMISQHERGNVYTQDMDEGIIGKKKSKPDSYHINKDGKPVSLASYSDKDSAIKDRDEKHPDAEVHQVGSRGKVKGKFEEQGVAEESKGLWANIHAKRERIKHGSGEHMRKPGSKGAPTADALRKSAK